MNALLTLPIVLPILGAAAAILAGRVKYAQRAISITVLGVMVILSAILLVRIDDQGTTAVQAGGWAAPMGITLVADRFSAVMLFVACVMLLAVLIYAIGQPGAERHHVGFQSVYLVLAAGVAASFLTGDLFNLFVAFEMLLSGSYVLLTFGGTQSRIRAGATYTVMALMSSMLFLIALAVVYAATGTLSIAQLAVRFGDLTPQVKLLVELLLLLAFAIKAAIFPVSGWLPDSYPTAPAPATAVFAGLLTKVGVYAIFRLESLLFPGGPVGTLLLWAALATLLIGVLGAVAQADIKRMLSFTLVSHVGYMVMGVGLATVAGLAGAVFYAVHHMTVQTNLFLVTGLIERRTGTTSVNRLGGLMRKAPLLSVLFFVPAMNLSGIPPMSGFLGKLALVQAGLDVGGLLPVALVVAALVTSLLTLYAIAKVWGKAFWREHGEGEVAPEAGEEPVERNLTTQPGLYGPVSALIVLGLAYTVLAGPLSSLTVRAAEELMARQPYINAVLGVG